MINDYFLLKNFYSVDECQLLHNAILANKHDHLLDQPADGVIKTSDVVTCHYQHVRSEIEKLKNIALAINKEIFGFNLFELNSYDIINFNIYDSKNKSQYGWHSDGIRDLSYDIKLTVLVNLSDVEYEGGNFMFFINGDFVLEGFKDPGDVLIFPSWTQHQVTSVTKGTRKSATLFLAGPKWQ